MPDRHSLRASSSAHGSRTHVLVGNGTLATGGSGTGEELPASSLSGVGQARQGGIPGPDCPRVSRKDIGSICPSYFANAEVNTEYFRTIRCHLWASKRRPLGRRRPKQANMELSAQSCFK